MVSHPSPQFGLFYDFATGIGTKTINGTLLRAHVVYYIIKRGQVSSGFGLQDEPIIKIELTTY